MKKLTEKAIAEKFLNDKKCRYSKEGATSFAKWMIQLLEKANINFNSPECAERIRLSDQAFDKYEFVERVYYDEEIVHRFPSESVAGLVNQFLEMSLEDIEPSCFLEFRSLTKWAEYYFEDPVKDLGLHQGCTILELETAARNYIMKKDSGSIIVEFDGGVIVQKWIARLKNNAIN